MKLVVSRSSVHGEVEAPPSKSYTHRAIILASLARGDSISRRPLKSQDTLATLRGMEQFGALARGGEDLAVRGGGCGRLGRSTVATRDDAETADRKASLLSSTVTLTGDGPCSRGR